MSSELELKIQSVKAKLAELKDELDKLEKQQDKLTEIYTDGSCIGNVSKNKPPAGWAFVVVSNDEMVFKDLGPVIVDEGDDDFIGADKLSNNTAELSAIYKALEYVEKNQIKKCTIFYDSVYAAKSVTGQFNGSKNKELINTCRKLLHRCNGQVKFQYVKAHNGNYFNEMADKYAKEGCKKRKRS